MTQLPDAYIRRMRGQLGSEAEAFLASYSDPRTQGLRRNALKLDAAHPLWRQIEETYRLEPVPWCPTGFYYPDSVRPGKSAWHAAGLYYMQEPSAMTSAELLAPRPGETVLDLAAAPGGKSTQLACRLEGQGLLMTNEIHPGRAKILAENLERSGVRNAVVTSMAPPALAARFPRFFDRIMLDAPCSGEGMFRKDPEAASEWTDASPAACAVRQKDILRDAVRMLKPGGSLAYSTCTFNREENEAVIDWLLAEYPAFRLIRMERIWPHRERGEGHFAALLQLAADDAGAEEVAAQPGSGRAKGKRTGGASSAAVKQAQEAMARFREFAAATLPGFAAGPGEPVVFGEQLYFLPHGADGAFSAERLEGVRALRPGLHLAELKKGRLEPAHALALASRREDAAREYPLGAEEDAAARYLRGEALPAVDYPDGWTLVTVDGFPLGWGKVSGGLLKNHYPKGLRFV
ncbi:RsmF rRNA methyltransferase first C-terminal domain-containing protein [Gorillibacterium sp. sgz500922]|uniref:RsmF rRNA methyltransferase first C-terminal domain-containing protein n=1 Tax=Gorillibacterium sp. sgz500922 TaxID=3446694 RepID=UPI003F6817E3